MSKTYQALSEPLSLLAVGPEGTKRSVHAFPAVLAARARVLRGVEALHQHLAAFLGQPRGKDPLDPDFGSSLHLLLDAEDAQQAAEVLQQVVRHEVPSRFGKYLEAIHAFEVSVHRETRTMVILADLKPHGAEGVSWRWELRFPEEGGVRQGGAVPPDVSAPWAADLIHSVRSHYPAGFPPWEDDAEAPVPAYQRTPEYLRWQAAWERAQAWASWGQLLEALKAAFPGLDVVDVTYPFADAHLRCCVYLRESLQDGGQVLTRVVGAASVLAPVYLVYVTTCTVGLDGTASPSLLTFEPTGPARSYADAVARHIEQVLSYRPFPLEWAEVSLPELRVDFLYEPPTLLGALFAAKEQLDKLP